MKELPAAKYHHVIFTVPDGELQGIMQMNKKVMYAIIMDAASETLKKFGKDERHLGARIGMIGVLHTWGQMLNYHVHVHFLVTAGGLSEDGEEWVEAKYGDKYLFPVRAMSEVYRGKFLGKLRKAYEKGELELKGKIEEIGARRGFEKYIRGMARHTFRVHSKAATKKAGRVVKYLGSYMKRVAISNGRLAGLEGGKVIFKYKDNRDGGKRKVCRMEVEEFIRRYARHILPKRFVRVRYYGIFAGRWRQENLEKTRELLGGLEEEVAEKKEPRCPRCDEGKMKVVEYVREPVSPVWLFMMAMIWKGTRKKYEDTS